MHIWYKRGFVAWFAAAVCAAVLTAALPQNVYPAEKKDAEKPPVTIMLKEDGLISPGLVTVELGTTVVWLNQSPEPVTIRFLKPLGIACKVPVNFYADNLGNYETGKIAQGETASICFIYKGKYPYEIKRLIQKSGEEEPMEQISEGKIIAVVPE